MDIKLSHGTYKDCSIEMHKYPNNRPALVLMHEGRVLLKASVNMPDHGIPKEYICIKDWSENRGVLGFLIKHSIVDYPEYHIQLDYVAVAVCKLNKGA